jgi:hypothetical protein
MKLKGIPIKGFRIDKYGKAIIRDQRRLDVSTRLKQAASKKIRPVRRTAPR